MATWRFRPDECAGAAFFFYTSMLGGRHDEYPHDLLAWPGSSGAARGLGALVVGEEAAMMADIIFASGACFLMVCGGLAGLYGTYSYWKRENRP